jgi:hypothetical protein
MIHSAISAHVHKDYIIIYSKNRTINAHLESFEMVRFYWVIIEVSRDI